MIPEFEEVHHHHHHHQSTLSQADLILFKSRGCTSAPVRSVVEREDSATSSSSWSSSSSESSYHSTKKTKNHGHKHRCMCRCFKCPNWGKFFRFFVGHAPEFTKWTTSYSQSSRIKYLTLFFIESVLRSIGNVALAGNPFSGLIIFITMLICCPQVAFLAFVTLTFGIETAVAFLRVPLDEVRTGVVTFNNFLTGIVITLLATDDVILAFPEIIIVCVIIGILTTIVWKGLNDLAASNYQFPMINAPFHVIILLYIFSGIAAMYHPEETMQIKRVAEPPIPLNYTKGSLDALNIFGNNSTRQMIHLIEAANASFATPPSTKPHDSSIMMDGKGKELSWDGILSGVILAQAQIFGTKGETTSLVIYGAVFLYSPILTLQSITGAFLGTLLGAFLTTPGEYESLYNGSWAYNPLLTSAALGGFFLVFNIHSWLLSLVGSILTTLLYSAMVKCHVPALGIPFMLITWLLLPSIPPSPPPDNQEDDGEEMDSRPPSQSTTLIRLQLSEITTPELNRRLYAAERNGKSDKYKSKAKALVGAQQNGEVSNNTVLPL